MQESLADSQAELRKSLKHVSDGLHSSVAQVSEDLGTIKRFDELPRFSDLALLEQSMRESLKAVKDSYTLTVGCISEHLELVEPRESVEKSSGQTFDCGQVKLMCKLLSKKVRGELCKQEPLLPPGKIIGDLIEQITARKFA